MKVYILYVLDLSNGRHYTREIQAVNRDDAIKLFKQKFGKNSYDITDVKEKR